MARGLTYLFCFHTCIVYDVFEKNFKNKWEIERMCFESYLCSLLNVLFLHLCSLEFNNTIPLEVFRKMLLVLNRRTLKMGYVFLNCS